MKLDKLAKILYEPETASGNMNVRVVTHHSVPRELWRGRAKDLQHQEFISGWIVVEVRIDNDDIVNHTLGTPDYNLGKIISVI